MADLFTRYDRWMRMNCGLMEIGDSYKSGSYAGVFVPCKVKFADGKTEKLNIAVRDDNYFGVWNFDGGL